MRSKKRIVIIDESAFIRGILSEAINPLEDFEIVGKYKNIKNYYKQIIKIDPDIIILELQKEEAIELDILSSKILDEIKSNVIIITNSNEQCFGEIALNKNFEFIYKKYDFIEDEIRNINLELKEKLKKTIGNLQKISYSNKSEIKKIEKRKIDIVLIGASTGGPRALTKILTSIDKKINLPILIVQHMPIGFTKSFAERLNRTLNNYTVVEAENRMSIESNNIYVAKGGIHLEVSENKKIKFDNSSSIWGVKPAVDKLFISASEVYKEKTLACILTGMGRDGAEGIKTVKKHGGITIAESQETCLIYGMPKAAIETGKIDFILKLDEIGDKIKKLIEN